MIETNDRNRDRTRSDPSPPSLGPLAQAMSEGVLVLDSQQRVMDLNPAAARMLGVDAGEVRGKPCQALFPMGAADEGWQTLCDPVGLAAGDEVVATLSHGDGDTLWVAMRRCPVDEPERVILLLRDVSAEARAHEALGRREARFRQIYEQMAEGVLVLDDEARVLQANPAALAVLGLDEDAVLGRNMRNLPVEYLYREGAVIGGEEARALRKRAMREGLDDLLLGIRPPEQDTTWVLINTSPWQDEEGGPPGVLMVLSDVTRRVQAEEALRQNRDRLEELVAERTATLTVANNRLRREIAERERAEHALKASEGFLQAIIDTVPGEIFCKDAEGRFVFVNERMADFYGMCREEMEGLSEWELAERVGLPREAVERFVAEDRQVLETGRPLIIPEMELRVENEAKRYYQTMKVPLTIGGRAYIVGVNIDLTQRKEVEQQLTRSQERVRESERFLRAVIDADPNHIFVKDSERRYVLANVAMGEMLGIPEEMFIGRTDREIVDMLGLDTAEAVEFERTDRLVLDEDRAVQVNEQPFTMADGTVRYLDISKWPVTLNGVSGYILGVGIDVTERRRLEEQLRQAVKMEAIGRLAGGVAHDFNNLLTVINGYVELALGAGAMDNALRADLEQVQDAGQRAADLTRRLLAFSRQQVLEMGPLDVNAAIEGMTQMLQRIIGEDVRLHLHLDPAGAVVRADQGQLEQMILNLAVNARDAMPQGGTLLLSTQRLRLAVGAAATRLGLDPGDYVRVTVRDTGVGMDALVQGHIFEPFFTTKEVGEGTGLGLAMVYGVVQDFGGAIEVDSVPGAGATFEIYLPLLQVAQETGPGQPMERGASCGGEAVLLVEDQESVRWLAQRVLRDLGYEVTTAGDASEAIRLCEARETPFDLLLVDVIMPDMGGPELVRRLARRGSRPRVLYMSGYAGGDDAPLEGGALLSKPFAVDELSRAVREALDGPRPD